MIYVTGASGYLGSHIMRLLGDEGVAVPRGQYKMCRDQVVIHCACIVPKTVEEANNKDAAIESVAMLNGLLEQGPRFVVFTSTRETDGAYANGKAVAEAMIRVTPWQPSMIVRFPGLFGPPRKAGLAYRACRAILSGAPFTPDGPMPQWYGMHVREAAQLCIDLARKQEQGLTVARNQALEDFLDWVRA